MKYWTKKICQYCMILCIAPFFMVSCDEETVGQFPVDGLAPSAIKNVITEPLAGGAKITYDLPDETDISYVICEYTFKNQKKVARSSIYNNYIIVEGLPEIASCDFTLYLVDHSENRSEPFNGSFTPLEPPYQSVFKTISMEPDFGGVVIRWQNETKALIGAFLYAMGDNGEWEEYDLVYSSTADEKRSIRGYNTAPRKFGISLVDAFGNKTDTVVVTETPLYEKQLDKTKFKIYQLLSDNFSNFRSRPMTNIWDGNLNSMWHTDPEGGYSSPQTFTIDLGAEAKLSRLMLWNRQDGYDFNQHNVHIFEVWGSREMSHNFNDAYWSGDEWKDEWTLLGDFEQIKPSGLPLGQTDANDQAATKAGSEFIFEAGGGDIRYVRFVVKETWAKTAAIHIAEISIFGDDGTGQ